MPKETLGLLGIPPVLAKILVPFCITHTKHPLTWYYRSYFPRLCMCILIAIYVSFTPFILSEWYFYPILICLFIINESLIYLMLVSRIGFYARISDPSIGGTYITLLSTLANLGASLTSSAVLYAAGWIQPEDIAYPALVVICLYCGSIWFFVQYETMEHLQALTIEEWHLSTMNKIVSDKNLREDARETCLNVEER